MEVGGILGPLVALAAGTASFFSPCVLPLVPVYLAQLAGVTGAAGEPPPRRHVMLHASAFVLGFSLVFVVLGASVGLVGFVLVDRLPLLLKAAGLLVIAFGLHLAGIVRIPPLYRTAQLGLPGGARRGYTGSALVGGAFALGWTPCIGPVLGSILALAATGGTAAHGALLLACYAAGLGIPFLAAGAAVGSLTRFTRRLSPRLALIEHAGGLVLVAMGILLFTDTLTRLNQYVAGLGIGGL